VDPSSTRSLARVWAKATPLAKFLGERAERLCREATPGSVTDIRPFDQLAAPERLSLYMQAQTYLMVAQRRAEADTINDLVAGKVVGLGRGSGSYDFEWIDATFWIGADVGGDSVTRDGIKIIEVRIVKPDDIQLFDGDTPFNKAESLPNVPHGTLGVQSAVELLQSEPKIEAATPVAPTPKGGRRSTDAEIRSKVRELWREPLFHTMKNRLDQAREVRARLKGDHTRHVDDMQGYTSSFIKRIIGEVANEVTQANQTE
jgi:hypothetical protein